LRIKYSIIRLLNTHSDCSNHIKEMKENTHIIISVDADKSSNKIHLSFVSVFTHSTK
jgi:hypothetical protein